MRRRRFTIVGMLVLAAARSVAAQSDIRAADSLLARGQLDRAESMYYAATRARPHDPAARWALGLYLWGRGASRIGATLIDEAKRFGWDKTMSDATLVRIDMDLGEYGAISGLTDAPMPRPERELNRWLVAHPGKTTAPDSTVLVAFNRSASNEFLGQIGVRINGQQVVAMILPMRLCSIRVAEGSPAASRLHAFGTETVGDLHITPAVADSIALGKLSITNAPVVSMKLPSGVQATICLGTLMRYAPSFDPRANLLTLRLSGIAPNASVSSTTLRFFTTIDGVVSVPAPNGWQPLSAPPVASLLRDRRWTFDARRGAIVVDP